MRVCVCVCVCVWMWERVSRVYFYFIVCGRGHQSARSTSRRPLKSSVAHVVRECLVQLTTTNVEFAPASEVLYSAHSSVLFANSIIVLYANIYYFYTGILTIYYSIFIILVY